MRIELKQGKTKKPDCEMHKNAKARYVRSSLVFPKRKFYMCCKCYDEIIKSFGEGIIEHLNIKKLRFN